MCQLKIGIPVIVFPIGNVITTPVSDEGWEWAIERTMGHK